jgi:hypothetical protein
VQFQIILVLVLDKFKVILEFLRQVYTAFLNVISFTPTTYHYTRNCMGTIRRCMSGFSDNCESGHESRHLCSVMPFQYPAAVELSLPTFENEGDQNSGLHLKLLREYFELKEIPLRLWLPLALRSFRGNSVRTWSVAITDTLTSYSEFENAFLGQFRDDITQNRVRCRLYQEKYDGSKGITIADRCLKFAALAKLLRPPMNETEILAALKCYFEPLVQRLRLTAPIKTVQDAVSLLKQIEAIGEQPGSRPLGQSNSGPPYKRGNQFHLSPSLFNHQYKQESYRGTTEIITCSM